MNYFNQSIICGRAGTNARIGMTSLFAAVLCVGFITGCGDEQSGDLDAEWYDDTTSEEALALDFQRFESAATGVEIGSITPSSLTLKCGKYRVQNTPSPVKRRATGTTEKAAKSACKEKLDGVAKYNTRCDSCDCTRPDTCYPNSTAVNVRYPGRCSEKSFSIFGMEFKRWECTCSSRRFRYSCSECQEPISSTDAEVVVEEELE